MGYVTLPAACEALECRLTGVAFHAHLVSLQLEPLGVPSRVAELRWGQMVGSEVSAVSVRTKHCNPELPSPDNLAALM